MEQEITTDFADDEGICGWPLGLLPVSARLSAASTSSNMMLPSCTPTSTSSASSSADSDSESATSFFPDNATLGSLIGIHSSAQFALAQDHSMEERHMGRSFRHRKLCSFISCGCRVHGDSLEASPSLSQYWDMERREVTRSSMREDARDLEDDIEAHAVHNNVYYHNECSDSCAPSLRLILQQHSPVSPWSDFNNLSHHHSMRSDRRRLHNFWHGFCGKLSSSLAT
ncbi:hypothetical protein GOP47_0021810 [Adiantum capillus-veneris]|uniref:Uncharacterized protein n=1 Tax=Adiantum capillus-veneris TaxID=13818 RepID=A0A9D4Z5K8_ADICA|nr:hypothetical protein GOP47_0021810 [Adiantum capillus-veneris]